MRSFGLGCSAALLAAVVAFTTPQAVSAELKIGVVNMERILRESKVANEASERLNAEGQRRQEEIEAISRRFKSRLERFEKNSADMDEGERVQERRALAEMERDVTRRSREAREEFNQRRNEEVLLLQNRAGRVVQEIAKKENFDLVLDEYFFASARIDLTSRVIEELDRGVQQKSARKK
ncbi:OmpH family outer membrane protein [Sutterella sp.]|uniref:OmpH family outer membrane protein n=1 Tax=Sutterella sp. TaxID=1981025 RepID=UPI0026DEAD0E|nr:OmpH family outer membrane protein [Sutterella sp.]MDO5531183.1 OmpH family outer membrane protein [Sutterella sp.]